MPPKWAALVESSLDVSSAVAAWKPSGRRSWLVALAGISAILALFVVGAPRERTLALHWLRGEYQARVQPWLGAGTGRDIAASTRALRPAATPASEVTPVGAIALAEAPNLGAQAGDVAPAVAAASSGQPESRSAAGAALRMEDAPTLAPPAAALPREQTGAVPAGPRANDGVGQTVVASADHSNDAHSKDGAAKAMPSSEKPVSAKAPARSTPSRRSETTATSAKTTAAKATAAEPRESRGATGGTTKARVRVAAARKPSPEPVTRAANVTKPRTTRQNPPRKDTGGGIIRETPF